MQNGEQVSGVDVEVAWLVEKFEGIWWMDGGWQVWKGPGKGRGLREARGERLQQRRTEERTE